MSAGRLYRTYIGIGSNLQNPSNNVRDGIAALEAVGAVVKQSQFYHSKPWGVTDQPDYVNAVVLLETQFEPHRLLRAVKELETQLGRAPGERWGPRVIDFDILTFDDRTLDETHDGRRLQIPHPQLYKRAFVLVPLAELDESFARYRDALSASERASVRAM